ncbi:XRE family transcriptional regulator [Agrobacterium sp. ICMP 7243]|uniref:helix-turn-helix domain-containing protein n=1 Tax=Rhizobium rhizogenes TaxID=359 RepID=UPI000645E28A|nr:helix-turn-helix transcriptional regulator [Rhizobium rhizogenes]KAA6489924.1 XRE family transcriptional regulator [Agrobacterium sp. ICMP 7243]NTF48827.1 helix-turn-helix transcriptional regulator [Rhizobium rhizogenes]NTH06212.1 helix-turn-helix transcriptional regulator [Rhizobium rhizogenes]
MLGLTQSVLASKAMITRSVLLGLEQPGRKLPDQLALSKLRDALLGEGLVFVDATEAAGEGVRFAKPSGKVWVDCLRYARAMLGYTLDELSEKSGVGRYVIARLETTERKRINEQSARRLRDVLFENGVVILAEEVEVGAGVRLRSHVRAEK